MGEIKASTGLILTEDEKDTLSFDNTVVPVIPVYEWLLSPEIPNRVDAGEAGVVHLEGAQVLTPD